MSEKYQQIIDTVKGFSVLELSELVKALEDEFGVSASAPVGMAMAGPAVVEEVEEQTEFSAILVDAGAEKLKVVKAVRELTGLALKEAKELVDGVASEPKALKEAVSKEEAEIVKTKIEESGGKVEIR